MINRERIMKTFLSLVTTDSGSRQEGKLADVLQQKLEELGFEVRRDDTGAKIGGDTGNLVARLPGTKHTKTLMMTAHMDRVTPGFGIKPQIRDGFVYSDGTTILGADDAAGCAAILEGVNSALEKGVDRPDIEVVFTVGEEIGLMGSKNLDLSKMTATEAYVLDSSTPVGCMIVKAPAQAKLNFKVIGKAAHGGVEPEKGINALQTASKAIAKMKLGRIDEETTANFGIVKGGAATNIVMETVEILGDARSLKMEKLEAQVAHMTQCFDEACKEMGATYEREYQVSYGPLNLKDDDLVVKLASAAIKQAGLEPEKRATGGGSDANMFNTRGLLAINLGCGYKSGHSLTESQSVAGLEKLAEVVLGLVQEYAGL